MKTSSSSNVGKSLALAIALSVTSIAVISIMAIASGQL